MLAGSGFNTQQWLNAIDVSTGTVVARRPALSDLLLDPVGMRLVVNTFDAGPQFTAYDRDLNLLGTFKPGTGSHCAPAMYISAHTERAYVAYVSEGSAGSYGPSDTRLMAIDLRQNRIVNDVSLVETLGLSNRAACPPSIVLWSAPAAPARLASSVTGREVTLTWTSVDLAAGYVIDVGGAPGRTDATLYVGSTTRVIFANPPSGIFYVRIRGGNVVGGGRPSNEVRVVVP